LILDNCEHVIEEAASVVEAILRACPSVRILATSRARPSRRWEIPLIGSLTPNRRASKKSNCDSCARIRLVALSSIGRSRDARFLTDEQRARPVAEIAVALRHALAMNPAARVKTSSAIVEKLDERFRILPAGRRRSRASKRCVR